MARFKFSPLSRSRQFSPQGREVGTFDGIFAVLGKYCPKAGGSNSKNYCPNTDTTQGREVGTFDGIFALLAKYCCKTGGCGSNDKNHCPDTSNTDTSTGSVGGEWDESGTWWALY